MKLSLNLVALVYLCLCQILVASAEFKLPPELSTATRIKLVVENSGVETDIDLKLKSKWVFKKDELNKVSSKVVWLAFVWDGKRHPQVLQVQKGNVLIFADKLDLTYRFEIPLDKFLSCLWGAENGK